MRHHPLEPTSNCVQRRRSHIAKSCTALRHPLDFAASTISSRQVRLEQCLLSGPAPVLCFWVGQVLTFYLATVSKLLGPQSSLAGGCLGRVAVLRASLALRMPGCHSWPAPEMPRPALADAPDHGPLPLHASRPWSETLSSVRALALRAFREQLRQRKDKSARYPLVPPKDLLPPQQVRGRSFAAALGVHAVGMVIA